MGVGAVTGSMLGGLGQRISDKSPATLVKIINLVTMTLAGALLFVLVGGAINWFYQINNPIQTVYWPAGIGGAIGLILPLLPTTT